MFTSPADAMLLEKKNALCSGQPTKKALQLIDTQHVHTFKLAGPW